MENKDLKFGIDARSEMLNGMWKLTDAVTCTMGPKGKCVCIAGPNGESMIITKDGVTVANNIKLKNKYENMGAQMLKDIAKKTNSVVGDGTTTSVLLGYTIAKNGQKYVSSGANPTLIKKGIDIAVETVVNKLKELSIPVSSKEDIKKIGTISANGDESIGEIITSAMEAVGNDGTILVEEGGGTETTVKIIEGMQFDRGYLSAHFITNQVKSECVLEKPYIFLYENKLSDLQCALPFLQKIGKIYKETSRPILLIAEDFSPEVLSTIVINKLRGTLNVCAIKSPAYGETKMAILEDLGVLCGAKVCGETIGKKVELVEISDLGTASRVIVGRDSTTIIGGGGSQVEINNRIAHIKNMMNADGYDVKKLQDRVSKLSGGIATICVGGNSELEMREKYHRIEDALHACKSAIDGIVAGGGTALIHCIECLNTLDVSGDVSLGVQIVAESLAQPLTQIVENSELRGKGAVVVDRIKNSKYGFGYDALNDEYCNLFERGVIDPLKTVINCLKNSASVSSMFLTTDCCIVNAD